MPIQILNKAYTHATNKLPAPLFQGENKALPMPYDVPADQEDEFVSTASKKAENYQYFPLRDHRILNTQEEESKRLMSTWIEEFLAKPNEQLVAPNRKAEKNVPSANRSVCPFIPGALKRNTIFLAVESVEKPTLDAVEKKLEVLKTDFLNMQPTSGRESMFKTTIITFPNLNPQLAPEIIDEVQRKAKKSFVKDGLMIGEFHELNNTPGLWNPEFMPLRTPVPALAVRYMVDNDLLFLKDPKYSPAERVEFLQSFLDKNREFKRNIVPAQEALSQAQQELKEKQRNEPGFFTKLLNW